jgi:hypothetical protein
MVKSKQASKPVMMAIKTTEMGALMTVASLDAAMALSSEVWRPVMMAMKPKRMLA